MHKILFTGCTFSEDTIDELKYQGLEIIPASNHLADKELIDYLQQVDAVIVNGSEYYSEDVLKAVPNLKVIQFFGIGYQTCIDMEVARKYHKTVMNTPKVNSYSVAEFTLGLLMTLNQKHLCFDRECRNGVWKEKTFFDLKDKTVGILGMGHIGYYFAEIMYHAFHANILYYDFYEKKEVEKFHAKKVSLKEIFQESDIVSLHLPLTDLTRGMIDRKYFSLMKKDSYFINTARAEIVDFESLYEALLNDQMLGCAFDGFWEEPVDLNAKEAKLLTLPSEKFLLTPHTAFNALEGVSRVERMCIENLLQFFQTGDCKHIVKK